MRDLAALSYGSLVASHGSTIERTLGTSIEVILGTIIVTSLDTSMERSLGIEDAIAEHGRAST